MKTVNKKNFKTGWVIFWLILFFPVGLFLVWKKTNWSQNTKIAVTIACVILFAMFSSGKTQPTTSEAQPAQQFATQEKEITYEVYDRWSIPNGGEGKVVIISPEYFNENDMPSVGEKLKKDSENDRNSFIFVFDDKKAASMRNTDVNQYTESEQDFYFKHFIAQYNKNANSGYHQFEIYFDTINGDNTKIIKY